jgi:anti-sigma regulatory factor (Ser/Thr protein kinase)
LAVVGGGYRETAMIAVRESLNEFFPAVAESVPKARAVLTEFARQAGLCGARLDMLRVAVSEAVTNVVVHAYRGRAGSVGVAAAVASGELWVLISDDGCGHQTPPENPGLGFGLVLMADACDDFVIAERAEGGTEARMLFRLEEPSSAAS